MFLPLMFGPRPEGDKSWEAPIENRFQNKPIVILSEAKDLLL
jgi:hypothetical protein